VIITAALTACVWTQPGEAPYRGPNTVARAAAALEHYTDIPVWARTRLAHKIALLDSDGAVEVTKHGVTTTLEGRVANLRDMNFRGNRLCAGEVVTSGWRDGQKEVGNLFVTGDYAVVVMVVCGNIARIDYTPLPLTERVPLDEPRIWDVPLWDGPLPFLPKLPDPATPRGGVPQAQRPPIEQPLRVPAPGTLWLAVAALALMAGVRR
jgi:hypothetical protein